MPRKKTDFEIIIKYKPDNETLSKIKIDIDYLGNVWLWQNNKFERMKFVEFGNRFRKHFFKQVKKVGVL